MGHVFFSIIFAVSVRSALAFDGPEPALAFYGVYHRNPWNQAIHFIGVPMILWSLLVLAAHVPLLTMGSSRTKQSSFLVDDSGGSWCALPRYPPTWATLIVLLYVAFYLRIDVVGALLYLPILLFMYKTAVEWTARSSALQQDTGTNKNSSTKTTRRLVQWAIVVHVLGWYLQIHPGHMILEGAQPAGVANLGAALTTAPLFAFYEAVWYLGFRKELQQRVLDLVAVYTQELCEEGSTMRVCETLQH
jgi:2-hydroxy fatty acid dioxygenase